MSSSNTKTVVFITGAFVTNRGWDTWRAYFESKGYTTYAPAWPYKEGSPEDLRNRQPHDTDLAALRLKDLIDHYANFIKSLPEKPIIIGHSLGGMITQILLERGLGVAAVAIHSVPPLGIIPYEFSFLKAGWKSLGLFTSTKKTYLMSLADWQYAFTNGMTLEEQKDSYAKNAIPESKNVARDGLSSAAKLDFNKARGPLLLIAGGSDNIIPATINQRNYKKYSNNSSVTDYKEFPGINHFVVGLPTWKMHADYILDWVGKH